MNRQILVRIFSGLLGAGFVFTGIRLFSTPVYSTFLEKFNAFGMLCLGAFLLFYCIKGKRP